MIFTTRSFAQCFSYVRSSRRGTRKGACRERARLLACVCTTKEFPASTEASHPLFSFVSSVSMRFRVLVLNLLRLILLIVSAGALACHVGETSLKRRR